MMREHDSRPSNVKELTDVVKFVTMAAPSVTLFHPVSFVFFLLVVDGNYFIKSYVMSLALNLCINKAIHVLLIRSCGLTYMHSVTVTISDVISNNMNTTYIHSSKRYFVTSN